MPTDAILQPGWQPSWQQCYADWLSQIERKSGRANTRRAYEGDVVDFFSFSGREPGQIDATHAEAWVQELTRRGLAPATLNRKLSSLSSLYRYAGEYPGLTISANPFTSRSLRTQHQPKAMDFPTPEQIDDLLAVIPTKTAVGLRNLALIAGLVATTRRISEWLELRGSDVEHVATLHWITYRCKGGQPKTQELPDAIWRITETYLYRAARWPLPDDAFLFVALKPGAAPGPLNAGYVAKMLITYGRAAGIPDACLYPHALRHAGAELRRSLGADILDLQPILGHASPATTAGYLRRLARPRDPQAATIGERLTSRLGAIAR